MNGIDSYGRNGIPVTGYSSPIERVSHQDLLRLKARGVGLRPVTSNWQGMRRGLPTETGAMGLRRWRVI